MNRISSLTMSFALILIAACKELPVASFTFSPETAEVGDTILFQNTSQSASTFDWDFGDGNSSTEKNPSHIYTAEDFFTILLVATNADGSDEASGSIWIKPPPVWTGIWAIKSSMPTARWLLSTSVVAGKIYAIGGSPVYGKGALRTVEEYDPVTDTWTPKALMPSARQNLSTSVVNGKIYAIGGGDSGSSEGYSETVSYTTVEEYDPSTDSWTTKSGMTTARYGHSASVVEGIIYVFGGSPSFPFTTIGTLEVYDPTTDSWTQKGNIPRPIINSFTTVVDGKIYAIGGAGGDGKRVDEYNPITDTWTQKSNMPTDRHDLSGSVLDEKIYVIGGEGNLGIMATLEVYDPTSDTWTTGPDMPSARWGLSSSMVDGKLYAIGGLTLTADNPTGAVEEYYK